jgi:hypothetical protein
MPSPLARLPSGKWWVTILGTLPASLAVGISNAYHLIGYGVGSAVLWVGVLAGINWPGRYNRKVLEGTLAALPDYLGIAEDADVRCTIYVPNLNPSSQELVPVTAYMPGGSERVGSVGKQLHVSKGIVGEAFRMGETRVDILADPKYGTPKELQKYLVERYHFTKEEARRLRLDRRAYLASPVIAEGNMVLGVIYMDTDTPEAFSDPRLAQRVEALAPFFHQLLLLKGG